MAIKVKKIISKIPKAATKTGRGIWSLIKKIGSYFKNSWIELRQVRWPNRRATWGMTAAVIFFTGFFVFLIIVLDDAFKTLFNLIIK